MLIAIVSCFAQAVEAVEVPKEQVFQQFGAKESPEALRAIDALVTPFGINDQYRREVRYVAGATSHLLKDVAIPSGRYALVDYQLRRESGKLKSGVQVWINRQTGAALVVPKSAIRAADRVAADSGYDLTEYERIIESTPSQFFVTFSPRSVDVADGSFTVKVNRANNRGVRAIYHWDGAMDKL